jgi:O-antigen/teichoic acid export membrane protein
MLAYAACQWSMLVAMARLGSAHMVGQFALGLAVSGPVMLLTNLELRFIVATDARREYRFGDYFGMRLLSAALGLVVIVAVALPLGGGAGTAAVIAGLGLYKAVEALSDLLYGFFQQRSRNDLMGRSLLLRGPLSLAALAGLVALTGQLVWGVLAMAGTGALVFLLHDLPAALNLLGKRYRARPRWKKDRLVRLALLSAPLGIVTMLFSLNTNLPSLILQRSFGVATVGLFAALLSLMTAGHVLINALGHSVSASLADRHAAEDLPGFRRLVWKICAGAVFIGGSGLLVAAVVGRPVLQHLFGPEYARESGTLLWVMAAGAAAYLASGLSYAMIACRRLRIQPVIMIVSLCTTLGLGLALIPRHGLTGAALALLGSALVQLIANTAVVVQAIAGRRGGAA